MTNVSLPPCTLQHLNDIEMIISNNMFTTTQREKMATAIQQNGYVFFAGNFKSLKLTGIFFLNLFIFK